MQNYTGLYGTIQDYRELNRTIQEYKGIYKNIQDYIGMYRTSENQNSQKINNAECFFCVLVYKEQGKLQLV